MNTFVFPYKDQEKRKGSGESTEVSEQILSQLSNTNSAVNRILCVQYTKSVTKKTIKQKQLSIDRSIQ